MDETNNKNQQTTTEGEYGGGWKHCNCKAYQQIEEELCFEGHLISQHKWFCGGPPASIPQLEFW